MNGAITGYIEVKKPGASIDPDSFTGHNKRQWDRQRDLPDLIYTNGTEWRLWRDGEPVVTPVHLSGGPLEKAGPGLQAPAALETLLTFTWYDREQPHRSRQLRPGSGRRLWNTRLGEVEFARTWDTTDYS